MSDFQDDRAELEAQAADWFVRLQSDTAAVGDWAAFEAWLEAEPSHEAAFQAVEALWVDLDLANRTASAAVAGIMPIALARRHKRSTWALWAAPLGLAAALALAVLGPNLVHRQSAKTFQTAETAKGERKSLLLADGTRVDLSSASKIFFQTGRNARTIQLAQGEAVFTVVHNPDRPFAVLAGDRRITDIGTTFDVARLDHAVQVTVKEGEVAVAPTASTEENLINVSAGRQLTHEDGDLDSVVRTVDPDAVLAWRSGRLVYRDAPLSTVVADLDRYLQTPIHVKGQKAAELRFSGVLVLDSEDAVVERLQAFMPVVVKRSDRVVWLSARP